MTGNVGSQLNGVKDVVFAKNATEFNQLHTSNKLMSKKSDNVDVFQSWSDQHAKKLSKLSLVILIHVFYADDGEIDKKEAKIINKVIKQTSKYLTYEEYIETTDLRHHNLSEQDVLDYAHKEHCTPKIISEAIVALDLLLNHDSRYLSFLEKIRKDYK